jgi:hypothetical protein
MNRPIRNDFSFQAKLVKQEGQVELGCFSVVALSIQYRRLLLRTMRIQLHLIDFSNYVCRCAGTYVCVPSRFVSADYLNGHELLTTAGTLASRSMPCSELNLRFYIRIVGIELIEYIYETKLA